MFLAKLSQYGWFLDPPLMQRISVPSAAEAEGGRRPPNSPGLAFAELPKLQRVIAA